MHITKKLLPLVVLSNIAFSSASNAFIELRYDLEDYITDGQKGFVTCESSKLGTSVTFNTATATFLRGVTDTRMAVTEMETGNRIDLRESEGWMCVTPGGAEAPLYQTLRHN